MRLLGEGGKMTDKKLKDLDLNLAEALEAGKYYFAKHSRLESFVPGVVSMITLDGTGKDWCPTACVTPAGITYWNADFILAELSLPELGHVLAHEYLHPILGHTYYQPEDMDRRNSDHVRWWAICIDREVHKYVELALPGTTPDMAWTWAKVQKQLPGASEDMTAEQLWYYIRDNAKPIEGDGFDGHLSEGSEGAEADKEHNRSQSTAEAAQKDLAQRICDEGEKVEGLGGGDLLMWANAQIKPPKMPWHEVLYQTIHGMKGDPSLMGDEMSFDQMHLFQNVLDQGFGGARLPIMNEKEANVTCIVDDSGSMYSEGDLVYSELVGTMKRFPSSEIQLVVGDSRVSYSGPMPKTTEELRALVTGSGGGTDFRPLIAEAQRLAPADVYLFITDGYGTAPGRIKKNSGSWIVLVTSGGKVPDSDEGGLIDWATIINVEDQ